MLYDLAERYEKALRLLSALLAKVLVRGDDRERLRQTAAAMIARYNRPDSLDPSTTILSRIPHRDRRTFELLYLFHAYCYCCCFPHLLSCSLSQDKVG